jgi:hypothetical protein
MKKIFARLFGNLGATARLVEIQNVLDRCHGGVYKRMDENRELLELLQKKAAPLLEDCPWIVGWMSSNDQFFQALEALEVAAHPQFTKRPGFPRAWPEMQPNRSTTLKLSPVAILKHLGFDVPEDGVEISRQNVFFITTALQLVGQTINVDQLHDADLVEVNRLELRAVLRKYFKRFDRVGGASDHG